MHGLASWWLICLKLRIGLRKSRRSPCRPQIPKPEHTFKNFNLKYLHHQKSNANQSGILLFYKSSSISKHNMTWILSWEGLWNPSRSCLESIVFAFHMASDRHISGLECSAFQGCIQVRKNRYAM